jgi:hypothetical protein
MEGGAGEYRPVPGRLRRRHRHCRGGVSGMAEVVPGTARVMARYLSGLASAEEATLRQM